MKIAAASVNTAEAHEGPICQLQIVLVGSWHAAVHARGRPCGAGRSQRAHVRLHFRGVAAKETEGRNSTLETALVGPKAQSDRQEAEAATHGYSRIAQMGTPWCWWRSSTPLSPSQFANRPACSLDQVSEIPLFLV